MAEEPRKMAIRLSILIATLARREQKFRALVDHLAKQAEGLPVEIVAYWNSGEKSIGQIRQALLEASIGGYICFIDDDDWVPDYYVKEVLAALGKDYVGFEVELYSNGELKPRVYHSLKYDKWFEAYDGYYRNVTHLNPIRREIALQGKFNGGAGEDESWSRQVAPFVKTENYIDRPMYQYYHVTTDSSFSSNPPVPGAFQRLELDYPCFRYIP